MIFNGCLVKVVGKYYHQEEISKDHLKQIYYVYKLYKNLEMEKDFNKELSEYFGPRPSLK